jgi:hypothetical protein
MTDIATRSMTETLLSFAEPLLVEADAQLTRDQLQEILDLVVTIWNAVAVDDWGQGTSHTAELEAAMAGEQAPAELAALFHQMVRRKRESFADDPRAIGNVTIDLDGDGGLLVRAEARELVR